MRRVLPFLVLVACGDAKPPTACGRLPQMEIFVGESERIEPCFKDPEGGAVTLAVTSADPGIATAFVEGPSVEVAAKSPGLTNIAITATDPDGLTASQDQSVLVPNRAPRGSLGDVELRRGRSINIDLANHFSDPDGQGLTYSASSSAPEIVLATVSGGVLTLAAVGREGGAEISVTASDGEDGLTVTFAATIKTPVLLISDDFSSDASLDDWYTPFTERIEDGYYILGGDTVSVIHASYQFFDGDAEDLTVDAVLRTVEEDAQAGFIVLTRHDRYTWCSFMIGEADYDGLPQLNWWFAWYDAQEGRLVEEAWSYGTSGDIDDFTDVSVSLSLTSEGVRATVDGTLLFEHGPEEYLVNTAYGFALAVAQEE